MYASRKRKWTNEPKGSGSKTRVVAIKPYVSRGVSSNEMQGRRTKFFNTVKNYPLPSTTVRTLKYSETVSINAGIAAAAQYVFSANGLYDPNVTGTGHQPYGFDQLMAMYDHYEVLESCIRVTACNTVVADPFILGVRQDDTSGMSTDIEAIMEMPQWNRKIIGVYGNGTSQSTVVKKFDARSQFASKDREMWGDNSSNPNDQSYFIVVVAPVVSGTDLNAINVVVEIEYRVQFHEPRELAKS